MDHILVEIDPDTEDTYLGTAVGRNASYSSVPIPIEAKVRSLSVKTLYEVCKVQTLSVQDLSWCFLVYRILIAHKILNQKSLATHSSIIYLIWSNKPSICMMKPSITPSSS